MRRALSCLGWLLAAWATALAADPSSTAEESRFKLHDDVNQVLYLMQAGHVDKAVDAYQQYRTRIGRHDFTLVQQMGLTLLDQGYRSSSPETQLLTLFGAGVSANEKALYILENSLSNPIPQLQLIGMSFLARYQNEEAEDALRRAMGSPHLLIRLEAAFHLAEKKSPKATAQIESLMHKAPEEIIQVFPKLFAMIGNAPAIKSLRKLMVHPDQHVRVAAILSAAEYQRDDLLPQIRTLATQHGLSQQEACAIALGELQDESSVPRLQSLAQSTSAHVKLAALQALYHLGRKEVRTDVEKLAQNDDLFAIGMLGEMPGSEPVLRELIRSSSLTIRTNAALALLERQDPRCLTPLCEVLLKDSRDLTFVKATSPGKGLSAWKVVPSARQNFEDNPVAFELALHMREAALRKALELPEKDFLQLASLIFNVQQNDLVPLLVELLGNLETPDSEALLKKYQQKAGAPLIRNYCNLALYKMKAAGPYADNLRQWITKQQDEDLIRFRTFVPWEMRDKDGSYELEPQETSRLLVDSFEAFAVTQDDKGVDILLEAIRNGNPNNKYALAGLLIHFTQ